MKTSSEALAKLFFITLSELIHCETVVLGSMLFDLDGAHERGDAPRDLPVQPLVEAVKQSGTIGIAAAGRIAQGLGLGGDAKKRDRLSGLSLFLLLIHT